MKKMKNSFSFRTLLISCLILSVFASCTQKDLTIIVNVNSLRFQRSDTVKIEVEFSKTNKTAHAVLLKPTIGNSELSLEKIPGKPGIYKAKVILGNDSPEGLYAIHIWTGTKRNTATIGKATFLLGKMIVDFGYPVCFLPENNTKGSTYTH